MRRPPWVVKEWWWVSVTVLSAAAVVQANHSFINFDQQTKLTTTFYELLPDFVTICKKHRVDFSGLYDALPRSFFKGEWFILAASGSAPVRHLSVMTSLKYHSHPGAAHSPMSSECRSIKAQPPNHLQPLLIPAAFHFLLLHSWGLKALHYNFPRANFNLIVSFLGNPSSNTYQLMNYFKICARMIQCYVEREILEVCIHRS